MLLRGHGTIFFTGATASVHGGQGFAAFSSAKFGLRGVAQAMARELGPRNIHVVHLLIDAGVESEAIHQRMKAAKGSEASEIPPVSLTRTPSIGEAYWFTHWQSRMAEPTSWISVRPWRSGNTNATPNLTLWPNPDSRRR